MLKPKKSIKKRDLKEDKFVKISLQTKSYIDENYQILMRGGVIAAFIVIVIFYFYYNAQQANEEASSQLGIAEIEYANDNLVKASTRLENLITEFDGTDAADQAKFILASIYYQQKKYDQALTYFQEFVDNYSGSNILLASGYAGLAACYDLKKQDADAAEHYETAAELAGDFTESDNYYFLSAMMYKKAGDVDKARSLLQNLVDEGKTTLRKNDAEVQLARLSK